ncbi:hypothetical protein [Mesorhizobium sp. WSM3224]|uniref:hypothetical protein n=1 Tax=Mesorhizobium sp. WSM3224 TaxID=1040986 RepID=UPI00040CD12D|nr:hypothetical protein [Mesorhizobium sp. WSM3224]
MLALFAAGREMKSIAAELLPLPGVIFATVERGAHASQDELTCEHRQAVMISG